LMTMPSGNTSSFFACLVSCNLQTQEHMLCVHYPIITQDTNLAQQCHTTAQYTHLAQFNRSIVISLQCEAMLWVEKFTKGTAG
jgi:hypothetical protein